MKCCICGKRQKAGNGSFFRVPQNEIRLKWIKICGMEFTQRSVICMDHFVPSDYIKTEHSVVLVPNAVPTMPNNYPVALFPTNTEPPNFSMEQICHEVPTSTPDVPIVDDYNLVNNEYLTGENIVNSAVTLPTKAEKLECDTEQEIDSISEKQTPTNKMNGTLLKDEMKSKQDDDLETEDKILLKELIKIENEYSENEFDALLEDVKTETTDSSMGCPAKFDIAANEFHKDESESSEAICAIEVERPKVIKTNVRTTEEINSIQEEKIRKKTAVEIKCRKELHAIQIENEKKRTRNLDLEYKLIQTKIDFYKNKMSGMYSGCPDS